MKMKKILLLFLSAVMLLSVVACDTGDENPDDTITDIIDSGTGTDTVQTGAVGVGTGTETLIIYPEFPEKIRRDYMYSVTVTQGKDTFALPVYNQAMESDTSRGYDGSDENRRFSTFAFKGEGVRVDIKVHRDFKTYSVMPSAKQFKSEYKDGVISVYLDKPDYFLVRLDDVDNTILSVFADEPEDEDEIKKIKSESREFIEVEGWTDSANKSGFMVITKPNTTIYLKPGCVLNARIVVRATDFRMIGHGAQTDPFADYTEYNRLKYEKYPMVGMYKGADNAIIEDIHVINAHNFNVMSYANGAKYYDLKILCSRICTDGIGFLEDASDNYAEHCFIYGGDNGIVFENNGTYKDLTFGNTCANLFPQSDVYDCTFEDIYSFRADDGVINNFFSGGENTKISNIKVNNLSTVDVTYAPTLFKVMNMGKANKDFTITNLTIRKAGQNEATGMRNVVGFHDDTNTKNYKVNIVNLYEDGKLISEQRLNVYNQVSIIYVAGGSAATGNTVSVTQDTDNKITPVDHHAHEVNYKAPNNVYIGKYQVFFEKPVVKDGDTFLLPYETVKRELYSDKSAETTKVGGYDYVKADALVTAGMATKVEVKNGSLYITPSTDVKNLLVDDSPYMPKISSRICYESYVIGEKDGDDKVIRAVNVGRTNNCGAKAVITDVIEKYGQGTYRLTLKMKASTDTSLRLGHISKNGQQVYKTVDVSTDWAEYTYEFEADNLLVSRKMVVLHMIGAESGTPYNDFSMKDVVLTKVA